MGVRRNDKGDNEKNKREPQNLWCMCMFVAAAVENLNDVMYGALNNYKG